MLNIKDLEYLIGLLNDEADQLCYWVEKGEEKEHKEYILKLIEKVQNIKNNL